MTRPPCFRYCVSLLYNNITFWNYRGSIETWRPGDTLRPIPAAIDARRSQSLLVPPNLPKHCVHCSVARVWRPARYRRPRSPVPDCLRLLQRRFHRRAFQQTQTPSRITGQWPPSWHELTDLSVNPFGVGTMCSSLPNLERQWIARTKTTKDKTELLTNLTLTLYIYIYIPVVLFESKTHFIVGKNGVVQVKSIEQQQVSARHHTALSIILYFQRAFSMSHLYIVFSWNLVQLSFYAYEKRFNM